MAPRLEKAWDYQRFQIWVRSSRTGKTLLLEIEAGSRSSSQQVEEFRGVALMFRWLVIYRERTDCLGDV